MKEIIRRYRVRRLAKRILCGIANLFDEPELAERQVKQAYLLAEKFYECKKTDSE